MKRIKLMELVRERQVGTVDRRDFLTRATAVLGSAAAANTLLAACAPFAGSTPPPVVDSTQPAPEPGLSTSGELETGIVTYTGPDGEELMGYLARVPGQEAQPVVIVIQEWWGLNEHIKDVTRRFAEEGYVALAPDLYHGQATTEPDEARKLLWNWVWATPWVRFRPPWPICAPRISPATRLASSVSAWAVAWCCKRPLPTTQPARRYLSTASRSARLTRSRSAPRCSAFWARGTASLPPLTRPCTRPLKPTAPPTTSNCMKAPNTPSSTTPVPATRLRTPEMRGRAPSPGLMNT